MGIRRPDDYRPVRGLLHRHQIHRHSLAERSENILNNQRGGGRQRDIASDGRGHSSGRGLALNDSSLAICEHHTVFYSLSFNNADDVVTDKLVTDRLQLVFWLPFARLLQTHQRVV
jgi:hypothetical protein